MNASLTTELPLADLAEAGWRTGWATTPSAVSAIAAELAPDALCGDRFDLSKAGATTDVDLAGAFSLTLVRAGRL